MAAARLRVKGEGEEREPDDGEGGDGSPCLEGLVQDLTGVEGLVLAGKVLVVAAEDQDPAAEETGQGVCCQGRGSHPPTRCSPIGCTWSQTSAEGT